MTRYELSRQQVADILDGEPTYRVTQLWEGLYRSLRAPDELTVLPGTLRARLADDPRLAPAFAVVSEERTDAGSTISYLLEAGDGCRVETVLMRYPERVTVCISSQSGCAMACSFCATGQVGFGRQLSSGEIVEQVVLAARTSRRLGWGRLSNIVFMGMGEPLANYRAVMPAVRRCVEDLGVGARSITISTVGVVPGIRRLAGEGLQVNLAVSLHAANDRLRSSLVPLNQRYPLDALMGACAHYHERTGRRLSFEWACIAGVNDRLTDAIELSELARRVGAHVNLIPLNPTPGYLVAGSTPSGVRRFQSELVARGVNVTVRDTRGRDAGVACGQLAGRGGGVRRPRLVSRS